MGAELDRQYLAAGLGDEIRIHLVKVLPGGGRRLFDQLPQQVELERIGVTETHGATHLEYHVRRYRLPWSARTRNQLRSDRPI